MKTLNRWKRIFSSAGFTLLVFLFFHYLTIPDYSIERILIRCVIFCLATMFLLASLILGIVKKVLTEKTDC